MSVTSEKTEQELHLYIDPSFSAPGSPNARIKMMENNHTLSYYLKHFLKNVPKVTPAGIAFFKGCLNIESLSFMHRMIMRIAMFALPEIKDGDFLNPDSIKSWTDGLFTV